MANVLGGGLRYKYRRDRDNINLQIQIQVQMQTAPRKMVALKMMVLQLVCGERRRC